ncbi:MAG TPA: tRNA (adenosine(37)-N6)-threonylcarbamoyltransferase complex dimerization subunit type 1 TsaB [Pseudacidobacterium sp.]|jgi:tRNA threonylcarbamoyladenosine biosynthesis protein TsaB|nr:tRNA (adenosine(37)-N6)-threonylcarbamoyltransferase complex dimerization subunit type 1 TsaB [Pseudacidobacterium sp.]
MLLAIDTCGSIGTLALGRLEGGQILVLREAELAGKTYSAMLTPRIRELLNSHDLGLQELHAIIAVNGPGSFTGVRVGLSTVKGLVEALDIPVISVSRLAVLAQKANCQYAALDAGRGEFYFGEYGETPHEGLFSIDEIRAAYSERELAICEEKVALAFPEARMITTPTAADALHFALPRLLKRDFDDPVLLDGNYLRRADAEVKMGALKA